MPTPRPMFRLTRRPLFRYGIPLLIAAAGLFILLHRGHEHILWRESASWPIVPGQIERVARLKPVRQAPSGVGSRSVDIQQVTLIYSYEVDGVRHTRQRFSYSASGDSAAQESLADFQAVRTIKREGVISEQAVKGIPQKGDRVNVRVRPGDPGVAVLAVGEAFEFRDLRLLVGAFLVAFGLIFTARIHTEGG